MDKEFDRYLKTLIREIRSLRKESGLTYKQLAKESGIPYNTLISLELRDRNDIQLSTVYKLAKFYKKDLGELLKIQT